MNTNNYCNFVAGVSILYLSRDIVETSLVCVTRVLSPPLAATAKHSGEGK